MGWKYWNARLHYARPWLCDRLVICVGCVGSLFWDFENDDVDICIDAIPYHSNTVVTILDNLLKLVILVSDIQRLIEFLCPLAKIVQEAPGGARKQRCFVSCAGGGGNGRQGRGRPTGLQRVHQLLCWAWEEALAGLPEPGHQSRWWESELGRSQCHICTIGWLAQLGLCVLSAIASAELLFIEIFLSWV